MAGLLLLAACCLPAPASATVRVANALNANRSDLGTPTRPVLDGLSVRYDDAAGDLTIILTFFQPLAEREALAGWDLSVYLADNVGTDRSSSCVPLLSPHNFLFTILLGSEQRAEAIQYGVETYFFNWRVSPDRRTVRLRGLSPRLAGLRLMCAHADLSGPRGEYSLIGAQLFSGYGPFDGNITTTARWALADEITRLGNRLGRAREVTPIGRFPRCRRTGRARVSCDGRNRLHEVRGRPTIAVSGRMTVSYTRSFRTRWRRDMRATLSWRRCPAAVRRERAGRRCSVTRRWRRGELSRVFRSVPRDRPAVRASSGTSRVSAAIRSVAAQYGSPAGGGRAR